MSRRWLLMATAQNGSLSAGEMIGRRWGGLLAAEIFR